MGSNISFQSRNVLSKKFMIGGKVRACPGAPCARHWSWQILCVISSLGVLCMQPDLMQNRGALHPAVYVLKGLDNINLFSIITIMAFCLLAPIAVGICAVGHARC